VNFSKYIFIAFLFFFCSQLRAERDSITVYYFLAEECVICQQYTSTIIKLHESYNSEHISFVGLFPNRFSKEESISAYKEKYSIPFTLKREFYQTKTKEFGVEVTPEVVVYNETKNKVVYKGRIDNLFVRVGKRRRVVTSSELEDVLKAIKSGEVSTTQNTSSVGCFINLI